MRSFLRKIYRFFIPNKSINDSPLCENGERVDIDLCSKPDYESMDMYQKNHYQRYIFARDFVSAEMVCGDFACGSGYGSALIAEKAAKVTGIDIKQHVVDTISQRYAALSNLQFLCQDLLKIDYKNVFDLIVSFETVEHVEEHQIIELFTNFARALKNGGILIFSTPYLQKKTREAIELGFHLTFDIDEKKIASWLEQTGFTPESFHYQNYKAHEVVSSLDNKEIVICVARKTATAS